MVLRELVRWPAGSNTRIWDETGDAVKAQGWAPYVLDTNGNGKVDEYTEPGAPAQAGGKDMRVAGSGPYAVMPHPTDGSIWYAAIVFAGTPGFMRFDPKTKLSEFYAIPKEGIGVRGGDIDKNGVLWGSGSNGTLISFDLAANAEFAERAGCEPAITAPKALLSTNIRAPVSEGFENTSAEASYYTWVDHHQHGGPWREYPDFHRQPQ